MASDRSQRPGGDHPGALHKTDRSSSHALPLPGRAGEIPLVGEDRRVILDGLVHDWEQCQQERQPRMVVLEGQPGIGKTRLVQELFAALAAQQPEPRFWPRQLYIQPRSHLALRGLITPERFTWDRYATPSYAWIGITGLLNVHGEEEPALRHAVEAVKVTNEPLWNRRTRRSRITQAVIGMLIIVGGLIMALLGFQHIGGGVVALLGIAVAALPLRDLPVTALRDVRREHNRWVDRTVIDFAEVLRNEGRAARDAATDWLAWLAARRLPAVVAIDDAPWLDEDSRELVSELLDSSGPVLIIATARPDPYREQWRHRSKFGTIVRTHETRIRVEAVRPLASPAMAEIVSTRGPLTSPDVMAAMVEHAGGNPLVLIALMDVEVIAACLTEAAYQLSDPIGTIRTLPSDYRGTFESYWQQLPRALQRAAAIAGLQGPLVETEALVAGCESLDIGTRELAQLRDERCWLTRLDGALDRFTDTGLLDVARSHSAEVVRGDEMRRACAASVANIVHRRTSDKQKWLAIGPDARRVALSFHITSARHGLIAPDSETSRSAVELAKFSLARGELRKVPALTECALGWSGPNDAAIRNNVRYVEISLARLLGQWDRVRTLAADWLDTQHQAAEPTNQLGAEMHLHLVYALASLGHRAEALSRSEALVERISSLLGATHPVALTAQQLHRAAQPAVKDGEQRVTVAPGRTMHARRAHKVARRLLRLSERMYGPEHRPTLKGRMGVAAGAGLLGRHDEAIDGLERALRDQERVLGATDPDTVETRHMLAGQLATYRGRNEEAYCLIKEELMQLDDSREPDEAQRIDTQQLLAGYAQKLGRYEEANNLFGVALKACECVHGPNAGKTLAARLGLAKSTLSSGDRAAAKKMLESVLKQQEATLGPADRETLETSLTLASRLSSGRESYRDFEALLARIQATLGPEDPLTQRAETLLAFQRQNRSDG